MKKKKLVSLNAATEPEEIYMDTVEKESEKEIHDKMFFDRKLKQLNIILEDIKQNDPVFFEKFEFQIKDAVKAMESLTGLSIYEAVTEYVVDVVKLVLSLAFFVEIVKHSFLSDVTAEETSEEEQITTEEEPIEIQESLLKFKKLYKDVDKMTLIAYQENTLFEKISTITEVIQEDIENIIDLLDETEVTSEKKPYVQLLLLIISILSRLMFCLKSI